MIPRNKTLENTLHRAFMAAYNAAFSLDKKHEIRLYISEKGLVFYHNAKIEEPIMKEHKNVPVKFLYSFSYPTDEEISTWVNTHEFDYKDNESEIENGERMKEAIVEEFEEKFLDNIIHDIMHGIKRI